MVLGFSLGLRIEVFLFYFLEFFIRFGLDCFSPDLMVHLGECLGKHVSVQA